MPSCQCTNCQLEILFAQFDSYSCRGKCGSPPTTEVLNWNGAVLLRQFPWRRVQKFSSAMCPSMWVKSNYKCFSPKLLGLSEDGRRWDHGHWLGCRFDGIKGFQVSTICWCFRPHGKMRLTHTSTLVAKRGIGACCWNSALIRSWISWNLGCPTFLKTSTVCTQLLSMLRIEGLF